MVGWQDGRMVGWQDGRMAGWQDGRMAGWKGGRMAKWQAMDSSSDSQEDLLTSCCYCASLTSGYLFNIRLIRLIFLFCLFCPTVSTKKRQYYNAASVADKSKQIV